MNRLATQHHSLLQNELYSVIAVRQVHGQVKQLMNNKIILAIETSCDETAGSLIEVDEKKDRWEIEILSNVVASQIDIHKKWGGVWPELASRAHLEAMIPVIEVALEPLASHPAVCEWSANLTTEGSLAHARSDIRHRSLDFPPKAGALGMTRGVNAIAVTQGPGLIGSLLMGTETANLLASIYKKPIIAVNHLEGHIYSAFCSENIKSYSHPAVCEWSANLTTEGSPSSSGNRHSSEILRFAQNDKIVIPKTGIFPILALVVSGGHTSLILMKDHLKYEVVGKTIDDAAGEAFDKVARILELGYPGGPAIEKLAQKGDENAYELPIALKNSMDFSFSGLKTAVLYLTKDIKSGKTKKINKADLAASFQKAVVDALILKTKKATEKLEPKTLILSGGVSANGYLRERFVNEVCHPEFISGSKKKMPKQVRHDTSILIPPKFLSTDNAVGIATAAALKKESILYSPTDPNLKLT